MQVKQDEAASPAPAEADTEAEAISRCSYPLYLRRRCLTDLEYYSKLAQLFALSS